MRRQPPVPPRSEAEVVAQSLVWLAHRRIVNGAQVTAAARALNIEAQVRPALEVMVDNDWRPPHLATRHTLAPAPWKRLVVLGVDLEILVDPRCPRDRVMTLAEFLDYLQKENL